MKKIIAVFIGFIFLISGCTTSKDYISMEEAKKKALNEINGEVVGYEKDLKDDEDPKYSFAIVKDGKKYDIDIDAINGEILTLEQDHDYVAPKNNDTTNNNSNTNNTNGEATHVVTQQEAEAIALDIAGGGSVKKAYLDHEDRHANCTWDVEVINGDFKYEVEVNADTKAIVSQEKDSIYD